MKPQSKLLFITGLFALTITCSGQLPSDKKPLTHFASDIIKVDSILSTKSHVNKQKNSNKPLHFEKCHGSSVREFNKGKDDWTECSVCPFISKIIWPNETDE